MGLALASDRLGTAFVPPLTLLNENPQREWFDNVSMVFETGGNSYGWRWRWIDRIISAHFSVLSHCAALGARRSPAHDQSSLKPDAWSSR